MGESENAFCALSAETPQGCAACLQMQQRVHQGLLQQTGPKQINCFAGLTDVAVPVMAGGRHVATLISGQVFRRAPTERDFLMVLNFIGSGQDAAWKARLRLAYFATAVVTSERFEAIIQLLTVYAKFLADYVEHHALEFAGDDPPAVASAKRYVEEHVEEPIELVRVAEHVHVNRFYFCKLFKRATGMTLTQYVTRVRLEKAKSLLGDPALRISEVVFASGFGSIPRFNGAFKQHLGMTPTAYRARARSGTER